MRSMVRFGAAIVVALLSSAGALAARPQFSARHIDELVAPIALYPDPLLDKMLMASTYPAEVWQADPCDPWPANAGRPGAFDPSVRSLAPFPPILCLMGRNESWTEQLGETFLYSRAGVMDEIQSLRRIALANGRLASNSKQVVTDNDGVITIEPASPAALSVPEYDANVVFAPWPHSKPPQALAYAPGLCTVADQGYCWMTWTIVPAVWGWDRWDWRGHRLLVDPIKYAALNDGAPPAHGEVWRHDPRHRAGTEYNPPHPRPAPVAP